MQINNHKYIFLFNKLIILNYFTIKQLIIKEILTLIEGKKSKNLKKYVIIYIKCFKIVKTVILLITHTVTIETFLK